MKVALAQIAPVWLDKEATLKRVIQRIEESADGSADLCVFGEGLVPGYPFWLSFTHGSAFNDSVQKEIHAHYVAQAVCIENGDLEAVCNICRSKKIAVYLGIIERPLDRSGHSLYCSLVYIDKEGVIQSVHRKLRPTYEERLAWSPGDGHGLRVHNLEEFTVGGLNCWENWMPLPRTALYGMGENLHIAVWPGCVRNTQDISEFIAKESRSFVVSVSGLFSKKDLHTDLPHYDYLLETCPETSADGGSCVVSPDGSFLLEPIAHQEGVFFVDLDITKVYEERQNFDPTGHYSRPDVTKLVVDRKRQGIVEFLDNDV